MIVRRIALALASIAATIVMSIVAPHVAHAQPNAPLVVRSPDGNTEVTVTVGDTVRYAVTHRGTPLITPSAIAMALSGGRSLGVGARVTNTRATSVDTTLRPVVRVKNATVRDRHAQLHIEFDGNYALDVRAYDEGVAYRWTTSLPDTVDVEREIATFRFARAFDAIAGVDPVRATLMTHQEPTFKRVSIDSVVGRDVAYLPFLVDAGGVKVAITESDLEDYAGMYAISGGDGTILGTFPAAARAERMRNDRDAMVTEREPYLARTRGTRTYPWRTLLIADEDRQLLENQLVYLLAPAQRISDVSWIRPGLVSWDWWNALNIRGVPFKSGVNTDTYKYYIDFASKHHIPYIILDEGWYKLGDLMATAPAVDMPALMAYGKSKNVDIILWVVWKTLEDQMTPALDRFAQWGVKGIKVDFMQRDDQRIVNFYWRTAQEAAKRKMLVDFHGAHKPAGLDRAYPNVISYEGVHGLENDKWTKDVTPKHDVTLPFTRMLAGPMDFTPGAMRNAQPNQFQPIYNYPMSQGTRAHQLAMYVVYESPLQMLADSPSEYEREPDAMAWLGSVPTTWDETRAIDGKVGSHVVMARRRGTAWYVGAMTDSARTITLDLSFLPAGTFTLESWEDGPNAARIGTDYVRRSRRATRTDRVQLTLAPGGGYAARIR